MSRSLTLILLLFLFLIVTIVTIIMILNFNDGLFMYTFDDAFIHMAYCKNIVLNGVWGITPYEFSSSTSSPLWTVLLAGAFFISGVNDYTLLVFNIIITVLFIITLVYMMNRLKINSYYILIIVSAIILLAPFSLHVYSGMEHLLHSLLSLLFIFLSSQVLLASHDDTNDRKKLPEKTRLIYLILLSFLLVAARYEGLFLIALAAFLLLLKRKYSFAILILLAGLLPVILYGYFSVSIGSYILPNSVILKSKLTKFFTDGYLNYFFKHIYQGIYKGYKVSLLFFPAIILWSYTLRTRRDFWNFYSLLIFFFISITLFQMVFSMINYWRYELNLIITGVFAISVTLYDLYMTGNLRFFQRRKKLVALFAVLFCFIIIFQGVRYFNKTAISSRNIYEQQYQMAMFLKEYYTGESIAANDIGAMNYYTDLRCLDLVGLASIEVTKKRVKNIFDKQTVKDLAEQKNVKIALVYDNWFEDIGGLPDEWIKVGEWKVRDIYILGGEVVSFYAVDPSEAESLRNNLKSFYPRLPSRVAVSEIK